VLAFIAVTSGAACVHRSEDSAWKGLCQPWASQALRHTSELRKLRLLQTGIFLLWLAKLAKQIPRDHTGLPEWGMATWSPQCASKV